MSKEPIPVKISILKTIYEALMPISNRLDTFLESYYSKEIVLSQAELTTLLEFRSASSTAQLMLEDYIEQSTDEEVEQLFLPPTEFALLLDLSKTAELSTRTPLANSGLWTH